MNLDDPLNMKQTVGVEQGRGRRSGLMWGEGSPPNRISAGSQEREDTYVPSSPALFRHQLPGDWGFLGPRGTPEPGWE